MTIASHDLPDHTDPPDENASPWLSAAEERVGALLCLPENWDSYGARRVEPQIANAAIPLLRKFVRPDTPQPNVLPTVRGGIQIEWHQNGIDLEIELTSPEHVDVSYEDAIGVEEWQSESSAALPRLTEMVAALSGPRL